MKHTLFALAALLPFCAGAYAVPAPKSDHAAAERRDSLQTDSINQLQTNVVNPIAEVVVTGTRNQTDIRHLPMTVSVVGRDKIESSAEPSLLPLLSQQVPGLFVTQRGVMGYGVSGGAAGGISLRGLSGGAGQLMVLIDGHPQYMGIMGHPISDAYQSLLAERVEVLRGPASVLYGSNAMGGVVNIVTRRMKEDGVRTSVNAGYGSYNTLQTEATNRIRKGRFTSIVSGSYNRSDGHRPRRGFEQYGGYAKLGYELTKAWDIRADINVTHFNAANPGEVTAPLYDARQHITRGMTSLALSNDYDRTSGSLSIFYNWGRHKVNDGHTAEAAPRDYLFNSRDDMMGISLFQSVRMFRGNRLTLGFDWYRFGGEAWNRYIAGENAGTRSDIVDKTMNELAGYVDFRQNIGKWLTLDAGVRLDRHSKAGTEWVPQAGLSFHLPAAIEMKLSAAKGFRYPTIREMYMWGVANPDLKAERMWNYEFAFSQRVAKGRLQYGVNLFCIDADNMIVTAPVDGRMMNVNTGRVLNMGVEAQIAWRIAGAWSANTNYSYLHMKYPVLASPGHKFYIGGTYSEGRVSISTGVQYVAGLYTATGDNPQQEEFVLWDITARVRVADWCDIWIRGDNLLAQRYEINAGFPMPGTTFTGGLNFNF